MISTVSDTQDILEVARQHPVAYIRYAKGVTSYIALMREYNILSSFQEPPKVTILYGPTGCGKTRYAHDEFNRFDLFTLPPGTGKVWFDGYRGQPAALFDEFAGARSKMPLLMFISIIDRYHPLMEVKGGHTPFAPKEIFITSNYHPRSWWDYASVDTSTGLDRWESFRAIQRRVSRVISFARLDQLQRDPPGEPGTVAGFQQLIIEKNDPRWDDWWQGPPAPEPVVLGPLVDYIRITITSVYNYIFA